jgi:hypothetical protein
MKKTITFFTVVLLLFSSIIYGQEKKDETYRYVNPEIVNNLQDYETAFSTADMTKFRFSNKSNVITFRNGLKVELFSANQLVANGVTVDSSKLMVKEPTNRDDYLFDISEDKKYILQKYAVNKYKKR